MELQKVSPNVYYVQGEAGVATDNQGFISNATAIVTEQGVVVVDALGTPSLAAKFIALIAEVTDKPIVKVIVTHYHADHIYGLQVFEDLGAEIVAPYGVWHYLNSAAAKERLEERRFTLDPWVNEQTRLVAPDVLISKGTKIELGSVSLALTPVGNAHSEADMTVYVEPDRVLISGDLIFEGRIPYVGDANTKTWLNILTRMSEEKLSALISGHGGVAATPNQAIELTRRYLEFLRGVMGAAVDDFVPFSEVYDEVDWSEFESVPAFDLANRRNAYQVYLSMEAEMLAD
jgi:glyoxylase-like metal-dependent hydrolase (beta-lactamase superfamily II)